MQSIRSGSRSRNRPELRTVSVESEGHTHDNVEGQRPRAKDGDMYTDKVAIVVGAGPAGSVAAGFLARRGFTVKVFDRRDDPRTSKPSLQRSFAMALKPSSVSVLQDLNVELPSPSGGFRNGLHRFYGSFQISARGDIQEMSKKEKFSVCGYRHHIMKAILTDAERQYPDNLSFHFNQTCTDVQFENQRIGVSVKGKELEEAYDLLIVADGVNSVARTRLESVDSDFSRSVIHSDRYYKVISSLKIPQSNRVLAEVLRPGYESYAAMKRTKFEGKQSPSVAYCTLNEDGYVHVLIYGTRQCFDDIGGKEEAWAKASLPDYFPPDWKSNIAKQLPESPLSVVAPITRVSKMIGRRTVVLGDASHSVTPVLGIGCNMAIGDGKALDIALEEAQGDIDKAVEIFNQCRYPEIQDIQDVQTSVLGQNLRLSLMQRYWPLMGYLHTTVCSFKNRWMPYCSTSTVYVRFSKEQISARTAVSEFKRDGWMALGVLMLCLMCLAKMFVAYTYGDGIKWSE